MNSDSISPLETSTVALARDRQVALRRSPDNRLDLYVPDDEAALNWLELWQQLKHLLAASERFWQSSMAVRLVAGTRLLDNRQLEGISAALAEVELQLQCVSTQRRQTAVAAATAGYSVEQHPLVSPFANTSDRGSYPTAAEPLYLKTTIRSGMEVRHQGTAILLGDVNPGGAIIASGDIIIWGRLRGLAHAGARGDRRESRIYALVMEPTQLRIANLVARGAKAPGGLNVEVAYIAAEGIRITSGLDFVKTHSFSQSEGCWTPR